MWLTIIVFVLILGLLIFVHEFGHFIVAKQKGVTVKEFAFGFGPQLLAIKGQETLYRINLFPLGGYIKMLEEEEEEENKKSEQKNKIDKTKTYQSKSVWKRMHIIVAGVLMNFLLAIFLFSFVLAIIGHEIEIDQNNERYLVYPDQPTIVVIRVFEDYPAYHKFYSGDTILNFRTIEEFQKYIRNNAGQEITLSILRNEKEIKIDIIPNAEGIIGVALRRIALVRYPILQAIGASFNLTANIISHTFIFLTALVAGEIEQPAEHVGGVVKVAQLTDEIIPLGIGSVLMFTGLLSINLAIINILPLLPLDGGHLLFLTIEGIKKKPVSKKIQNIFNTMGFILLISLILLITVIDIERIIN